MIYNKHWHKYIVNECETKVNHHSSKLTQDTHFINLCNNYN